LSFYVHIKTIWSMIEPRPIPLVPQPEFLQEFYRRFSNAKKLHNVASDTSSSNIVPRTKIQTLKGAIVGQKKVGQVGCPNLEETPESLLNSECRISAIGTFRQIAAAEAYAYMNINKAYLQSFDLFFQCYNHFKGSCHRQAEKKAVHKGREQVSLIYTSLLWSKAFHYTTRKSSKILATTATTNMTPRSQFTRSKLYHFVPWVKTNFSGEDLTFASVLGPYLQSPLSIQSPPKFYHSTLKILIGSTHSNPG
ncbi:hypothetical protein VP01_6292g1, partial [Puccinia sorghi]